MQLGDGWKAVQPCSHSPLAHKQGRLELSLPLPQTQFPDGSNQTRAGKFFIRNTHGPFFSLSLPSSMIQLSELCSVGWARVSLQAPLCKACHETGAAKTAGHSPGLQNPSPEYRTLDCTSRKWTSEVSLRASSYTPWVCLFALISKQLLCFSITHLLAEPLHSWV